jgi:pimeloyl-ACP methyl ester carboxylesterase
VLNSKQPGRLAFAVLLATCAAHSVHAQSRIGVPTLGGAWLWSDEVVYSDWRIQKNARSGKCRLLDPHNFRYAVGDFADCLAALNNAKLARQIPAPPTEVVIVLHGLGANRTLMNGLCDYLRDQGRLYVVNVTYPSTMLSIQDYARSLHSVIRHLDGVQKVSFVAHSMGNIVVRKYLKDIEALDPASRPRVAFGRMVMIAPPNHGAELADTLTDGAVQRELAELFVGEPARQLAPNRGWPELEPQLATPGFPFGIIAGGKGDAQGFLDAVPGDDDGLLSVESAKLVGAADFVQVVAGIHQLMPRYEATRTATLTFLRYGYFVTAAEAQPILAQQP